MSSPYDRKVALLQTPRPADVSLHLRDFALELADGYAENPGGLFTVALGLIQNIGHVGIVIFLQGA